MPKEYFHNERNFPEPANSAKITWSRIENGGHVQMCTYKNDDTYKSEHDDPMYIDLDREQINRMIKTLRRARDQAFGRDE